MCLKTTNQVIKIAPAKKDGFHIGWKTITKDNRPAFCRDNMATYKIGENISNRDNTISFNGFQKSKIDDRYLENKETLYQFTVS